jgi:hypothetical protein
MTGHLTFVKTYFERAISPPNIKRFWRAPAWKPMVLCARLDPGMQDIAAISELLEPYHARFMRCYGQPAVRAAEIKKRVAFHTFRYAVSFIML